MGNDNKNIGQIGEDIAARLLSDKGYEIVERNYRYGHGEIDIIARDNEELVFVEVKTRKNLEYGEPEYSITVSKQKQIRKIAEAYLYEKDISDTDCRIDVVAIILSEDKNHYINHIVNAF